MNTNTLNLIADLSNAFGPSGFEDDVYPIAMQYCQGFAQVTDDCMRNIYIRPRDFRGDRPIFMLDAHCDEVGFMVHSIRPNGSIRFINIGYHSHIGQVLCYFKQFRSIETCCDSLTLFHGF